jgi:hypothetical protein
MRYSAAEKYNAYNHGKCFLRFWALVLGSFSQVHKSHLAIWGDDGIVRMDVAVK